MSCAASALGYKDASSSISSDDDSIKDSLAKIEKEILDQACKESLAISQKRSRSFCFTSELDLEILRSPLDIIEPDFFTDPLPQLKILKEIFIYSCYKKVLPSLLIEIEALESLLFTKPKIHIRETVATHLLSRLFLLSLPELEEIEKKINFYRKTFSIINIRDILKKTFYYQYLIDRHTFITISDKKIPFEQFAYNKSIKGIKGALTLLLNDKQWDLFVAFCADTSPENVIPILDHQYKKISKDPFCSSEFLKKMQKISSILNERYHLPEFEKELKKWVDSHAVPAKEGGAGTGKI